MDSRNGISDVFRRIQVSKLGNYMVIFYSRVTVLLLKNPLLCLMNLIYLFYMNLEKLLLSSMTVHYLLLIDVIIVWMICPFLNLKYTALQWNWKINKIPDNIFCNLLRVSDTFVRPLSKLVVLSFSKPIILDVLRIATVNPRAKRIPVWLQFELIFTTINLIKILIWRHIPCSLEGHLGIRPSR